jgi:hypothetical protein
VKSKLLVLFHDKDGQVAAEDAIIVALGGPLLILAMEWLPYAACIKLTAVVLTPKASLSGVVDAIQLVGKQRNALFLKLRTALDTGNDDEALNLARELCGLERECGKSN